MVHKGCYLAAGAGLAALLLAAPAAAQKAYDPGASDSEIKIGNFMPYSGPASAYGTIGATISAYFEMVNAEGGINGRKITFLSYDNATDPAKSVEQTRRLIESDEVLFLFQTLGTQANLAVRDYVNEMEIPHLFIATGADSLSDPENYPWTIPWNTAFGDEGRIYARYILDNLPDAKIAVLYQSDDTGKEYLNGLVQGLGGEVEIVATEAYNLTDATVESQMANLKASGADVFISFTSPKFAAQAIAAMDQLDWNPVHIVASISALAPVLKAGGIEQSTGTISAVGIKDPTVTEWQDDADYAEWVAFMEKWYPDGDRTDIATVYGYSVAATMVEVLKRCGDNLTRANIMAEALNLKDFQAPMFLPGVVLNTSPTDYRPVQQAQMERFDGDNWVPFGPVIDTSAIE